MRQLQLRDLPIAKKMKTNITDDYVIEIFERLVTSENQSLYGLFIDEELVTIAGYTIFPGGYAMLGRLRSDVRVHGKGYATELLLYLIEQLKLNPKIVWIGGNTNIQNSSARRVLSKLGFSELKTFYGLPIQKRERINNVPGHIWQQVHSVQEKRALLTKLAKSNILKIYPYECFYPFPFRQELVTDEDLAESHFFQNPSADRWVILKKDFKKEAFVQVKYFWNDHFEQPGLFETIDEFVANDEEHPRPWFDFTEKGYKKIPDLTAFEVSDGWVLYGDWV